MKLLTNEELIVYSSNSKVTLTNYRVYMSYKNWGHAYNVSVFLEDISSIQTKYTSNLFFVILSIISAMVGLVLATDSHLEEAAPVGFVMVIVFLLLYWFSRKNIVSIASDGGASIIFRVEGMSEEAITNFIHDVSLAKLNRVYILHTNA